MRINFVSDKLTCMNISTLAQNLRGAWMITPEQAAVMMPVLKGILSGNLIEFDKGAEPFMLTPEGKRKNTDKSTGKEERYVFVSYLQGTMLKHDGECGEPGTRRIGQGLLDADNDPSVIGHIIVAESGGGACNSVAEISDAITKCSKPVVAYIDGIAGSACMYAISYADHIMAHKPMDEVGCIGVMIQLSGLPKYHQNPATGEIYCRIYATESQEKNLDYEAALEGDAKVIREERLDPLCEQFMADIKANRPGVTEDQLHGKIYFAKDVVGSLIDSIGSFDDALAKVLELAEKQEESKSSQMAKYAKLESIPELKEQVYAEDGSTVLQACQLQAIEQALTTPRAEENELRSQMDTLKADHEKEVTGLQQTIAEKEGQISQKDARISELEAALSAAIAKNNQEDPASVHTHADPANSGSDESAPAKNFAEAEAACKEFLKHMSNN